MKRLGPLSAMVLCLLVPSLVFASERRMSGKVLLTDDLVEKRPAQFIEITIVQIGNPNLTDQDGIFSVFLPDKWTPGKYVTFQVKKDDYLLQIPLDGEYPIPEDLDRLIQIVMLKKGSPKLLSPDRVEKLIENSQEKGRARVNPAQKETKAVDLTLSYQEEARRLGLPEQAIKRAVNQRAGENREAKDPHTRAIAATAGNDPQTAAKYYAQAANQLDQELKQIQRAKRAKPFLQSYRPIQYRVEETEARSYQTQKLIYEIVKEFRLAGHAYYNSYAFKDALRAYERAFQYVSREDDPYLWASVESDRGIANWAIGIRAEGPEASQLLGDAVTAYQHALEVHTRTQSPQQWAMTQNNLGVALQEQGIRAEGPEASRLLGDAVTAYRHALEVHTRTQFPQDWAGTQNNLGNTLSAQGIRAEGPEASRLLEKAVIAYQQALEVFTRTQFPYDWARTQNNLGNTLQELLTRSLQAPKQ